MSRIIYRSGAGVRSDRGRTERGMMRIRITSNDTHSKIISFLFMLVNLELGWFMLR